jgi:hypothetical protein
MTVAEFKQRLASASLAERRRLIGKLLREARDTDVWGFITPSEVWSDFQAIARHLGRRRSFWEFLLKQWQEGGLLGER